MIKEIVITVIEVEGKSVSYSGSLFDGCHISNFPDTPSVGNKYILVFDSRQPAVVISIRKTND